MEIKIKAGPQGHYYLPKRIRENFGKTLKLLPNATAAVIYPQNADLGCVIDSLEIIIADLKLRIKAQSSNREAP